MNLIVDNISNTEKFKEVERYLKDESMKTLNLYSLIDSAKAHIIYALTCRLQKSSLIICSNEYEANKFIQDLKLISDIEIIKLPAKKIEYFEIDAQSREIENQRMYALRKINSKELNIVVTTINAMIQQLPSYLDVQKTNLELKINTDINLNEFTKDLINMGYERTELVEGKGQFAIRGGIIDIFAIDNELPYRIELFGDEIDSIRTFDIQTQRSIDVVKKISISCLNQVNLTDAQKEDAISKLESLLLNKKIDSDLKDIIKEDIEKIKNFEYQNLVDKYFELMVKEKACILDYVKEYNIYINDENSCKNRAENEIYENEETIKILTSRNNLYDKYVNRLLDYDYFEERLKSLNTVYLENIKGSRKGALVEFDCKETNFHKSAIELLISDLKIARKNKKCKSIMIFPTDIRVEQVKNYLIDNGQKVEVVPDLLSIKNLDESKVYITKGIISSGYLSKDLDMFIMAEAVSGVNITKKKKDNYEFENKNTKLINNYDDLKIGDYIVHENHGIGIYRGTKSVSVEGVVKDYILLEYANSGSLYIPITQLDSVRKYVCDDNTIPKINSLNSKEWQKEKQKVKKNVEEIAKELVLLYAKRNKEQGFAFSKDTPWQREFEDSFKYELTYDQKQAIKEVKADMESPVPMDRLLCGDVGYGKTEVAIRAAFKAVMDSKQVAYLVPTTVLSYQQYTTFKNRMEPFGIKVEMLSRFRTKKEQTKILKDLVDGKIDIIIGTHRLLSKDVFFKDLGFLIIDEEHRFGVKAKEKIKMLKKNIDVLSMSATPIPRTLHMSMVGIREMSTLNEPPMERLPVHTYVMEYNEAVIKNAIEKELLRDGQVIYLDNRVETIDDLAQKVKSLVSTARVGVAHGKMSPSEIEDVMMKFMKHELDIIVCTTILETGIDIQNANTLIVENADKLGLAQLYQIRGRVGRSSRLAYAYITYKKNKQITEVSQKRLKAIKDFTEFGSGFKIALRDLEIRGTGNILGKQQHGHMARVGYEMYMLMLERAIEAEKKSKENGNENENKKLIENEDLINKEVKIELNVSAYISDDYIKDPIQKIIAYQKISDIKDNEEMLDVIDEFIDRYGNLPKETDNLIKIVEIRNLCRKIGITKLYVKNNYIIFEPINYKCLLTNNSSNDILLTVQFELNKLKKMNEKG